MFKFIGDIKAELKKLHDKFDVLLAKIEGAPKAAEAEVQEGVTKAADTVVEDVKKEV